MNDGAERAKRMVSLFRAMTDAQQCQIGVKLGLLGMEETFKDAEGMRQAVFTRAAEKGKTLELERTILGVPGVPVNRRQRRAAKAFARRS